MVGYQSPDIQGNIAKVPGLRDVFALQVLQRQLCQYGGMILAVLLKLGLGVEVAIF